MIHLNEDILFQSVEKNCITDEFILFDNYSGECDTFPLLNTDEIIHIDQMAICCVMQGMLRIRINGKEIAVCEGQVLTILPESGVILTEVSSDCKYIMFAVYPNLLKKTFEDIYIIYDRTVYEKCFIVGSCTEEQMSMYQVLYTELKKECNRPQYKYKPLVVRSYLNVLLINNVKIFNGTESTLEKELKAESRQYEMFQKFLDALNLYAKTERTVQFYADLLHITPKYLSYVSLQFTGKNASRWIGEYVVHHAKILISIHHKTSAEIAAELNFPTLISYNRFFKRIAGISPKMYRKTLEDIDKVT